MCNRLLKILGSVFVSLAMILASLYPLSIQASGGHKVPHIVGFNPSTIAAGYYTGGVNANGQSAAAEAEVQFYITKAGTYTGLSVNVTVANATGDSTLTFRKNGADGNNTVTVSSGATGLFQDTTNSDTVAVGDLVNFNLTYTAGSAAFSSWTILFEADDGSTTQFNMAAGQPAGYGNNNAIRYMYPVGTLVTNLTTESLTQNMINHNCVMSNFGVYVSANTRTTTTTFRPRVNAADAPSSGGVVQYTSTQTGLRRNTSTTVTLTAGDLIDLSWVTGGSGNLITISNIQYTLTSDNPREITIMGGSVFARSSTASAIFGRVADNLGLNTGTETQNRVFVGASGDISKWAIYVSSNLSTRDMDIVLRISGATGTNSVTNTLSTTGWLQDTTHTDAITASDYLAFRSLVNSGGAGTGNVTYNATSFLLTLPDLATFTPFADIF